MANNVFGMAFSLSGLELLRLKNVQAGFILLWGYVLYYIFWVSLSLGVSISRTWHSWRLLY